MIGDRWRDELVSAGYWGLFKALRNRRADAHERELSAYVSRRIEGAVIDEARTCLSQSTRTEASTSLQLHGIEEPNARTRDIRLGATVHALNEYVGGGAVKDPEHIVEQRMRRSAIDHALDSLEPEQRAVLRAYMEGDSLSEIARAHGVSAGTMQGRFEKLARRVRAKAPKLRRVLLDVDVE